MREVVIASGILALLGAVSAAILSPWQHVFDMASWVTGAGLVVAMPSSLVYHLRLRRALASRRDLPRGWYWRPLTLHDRLLDEERVPVLAFAYVGGLGFVVICFGLLLLVTAVISAIALGP